MFLLLLFILTASSSFAEKMHSIVQQPRTWAMGGAGVGLADDEYALFQNVAGLAGNDKRDFKLLGLSLEGSTDIYDSYSQSTAAFRNFSVNSLNALMGKNIYMRVGATPMVRIKHFSIAYVVDSQFSVTQLNQVNPYFDLGAMMTHGIQMGYGWSINSGKRAADDLRFGVATKFLWRKGGYYSQSTADLLAATNMDGSAYLNRLMGDYSLGMGFDAGTQAVHHLNKFSEVSAGLSLTDIGGTHFKTPQAMPIPMDLALGLGYKTKVTPFSLAAGIDYRNMLVDTPFANHLHLGVDVGMPLFNFYAGLNQLYATYGLVFDIWIVKISAITYGEELGISFRQNASRKYLFQFDFKLPI